MKGAASIFLLLASAGGADEMARPLSDVARVGNAVEVVFVDGTNTFDGPLQYTEDGPPIKVDADLKALLTSLETIPVREQFAPFIGHLGHVALKDQAGKIIGILGVINHGSTFSIADADLKDGKIIEGCRDIYLQGKSLELAKWMYGTIEKRWPERIKKLQQYYRKVGEDSLEAILFGTHK